jgi:hypothetical protein
VGASLLACRGVRWARFGPASSYSPKNAGSNAGGRLKAQCHLVFDVVCNILISLGDHRNKLAAFAARAIWATIWPVVRKSPVKDPTLAEKHKCLRMFRLEDGFEN